jgi:hypothetical protein
MKETTPAAMPPCFDRWCQKFDDIFGHLAQKREFRNYVGGLLGERRRWANKPLNTFTDALEAFRTAISFRESEMVEPKLGRILRL